MDEQPPPTAAPTVLPRLERLARRARTEAKISRLEQRLLLRSMEITSAELGAADLDDDNKGRIPDAFQDGSPPTLLARRVRIAQDARQPAKQRPGYLTTAAQIAAALLKARASAQTAGAGTQMNVQINVLAGDQHVYPSREES